MGTLFKNNRVEFIENSFLNLHNYILDGEKELIGVTSLIKKHSLAEGYDGINPVTLRVAAEIGTAAHRYIESYCNGEAVVELPLLKSFQKQNIRVVETEYLMSDNETVASSMDLLAEVEGEPDTYDIIDIKRTEKVHYDSLQWQLGFYKWLFLMANPWAKVRGCYCLHVKKGMKSPDTKNYADYNEFLTDYESKNGRAFNAMDYIRKDVCEPLIEIQPKEANRILQVIEAERLGRIWSETPQYDVIPLTEQEKLALPSVIRKMSQLEEELKATKSVMDDVKARIYDWMIANGRERLALTDDIHITLKKGSTRTSIDAARLREDYAEIAEKYSVVTNVKGSLIFKIK